MVFEQRQLGCFRALARVQAVDIGRGDNPGRSRAQLTCGQTALLDQATRLLGKRLKIAVEQLR